MIPREAFELDALENCSVKAEIILEKDADLSLFEDEYKRLAAAYSMDVEEVKARMAAEDVKTDLLARKAGSLIADNAVAVAPKAEEAAQPEE